MYFIKSMLTWPCVKFCDFEENLILKQASLDLLSTSMDSEQCFFLLSNNSVNTVNTDLYIQGEEKGTASSTSLRSGSQLVPLMLLI